MRRTLTALLLLAASLQLSGCIVEAPGPRGPHYCYYHPYACR